MSRLFPPYVSQACQRFGEFSFAIDVMEPDADGDDAEVVSREITVPWTTIKEIMSAIRRLTHQEKNNG